MMIVWYGSSRIRRKKWCKERKRGRSPIKVLASLDGRRDDDDDDDEDDEDDDDDEEKHDDRIDDD